MTFSGKWVFADVIKLGILRWDHPGLPWWAKSNDNCPYDRRPHDHGRLEWCRHRPRSIWSHLNLAEPRIHPPLGKNATLPTPWLWTSGLQNCERIKFCCLSHKACDHLVLRIQGRCTERIGDCRAGESGSLENQVQSWVCCWWLRWTLLTLSFRFISSPVPHMPGPHSWAQGSLLTWRSYSKSKEVRWDTPYLFGMVVTGITTLLECWIHTRYVYIHYLV